jgi:serine/threonine protein kinase
MVAQVTRPLAQSHQSATPTTLAGGAFTLSTPLCTTPQRTLFAGFQRGITRPVLIERIDGLAADVMREAVAYRHVLTNLCHPGIAQVVDSFAENGALFTVMSVGEGAPLCARPTCAPAQAVAYGIQICNALGYLAYQHQHLDAAEIAPATVFVTCAGRARLTALSALVGAPAPVAAHFTAPNGDTEQRLVFSLGATLHHALTGWHGWYSTGAPELPGIPPELNAILMRALALDPAARYATVAALRLALLRLQ